VCRVRHIYIYVYNMRGGGGCAGRVDNVTDIKIRLFCKKRRV